MSTTEEERLRRALQDAIIAFDTIISDEIADGDRNSGAAIVARGAVRKARAALSGPPKPSEPGPYSGTGT